MTNLERRTKQAENILHAARQLFASQGYHGTSTREIARLADVSENTLFRYFERKEDLFWAVLRSSLSGLELHLSLLAALAEGAAPETVLPKLFRQLVDVTILRPELLRLIGIALIELPLKASAVLKEHLSPLFTALNEYVAKSMESGKLRKVDSSLAITAMIATVLGYPALSTLIGGAPIPYADSREAVSGYSDFWLAVLAPSWLDRFKTVAQTAEIPKE